MCSVLVNQLHFPVLTVTGDCLCVVLMLTNYLCWNFHVTTLYLHGHTNNVIMISLILYFLFSPIPDSINMEKSI